MANQIKKLINQTAIYGLSSIVGRLLNYLLVPLYTRVFIPSEYGKVAILYTYVGFLFIFLTYGMETGFFRFSKNDKYKSKVYASTLLPIFISSLLFVIAVILYAEPISKFINFEQDKSYIIWFAIIIGVDTFTAIPFAKLRLENKAARFATIKIINIVINIGFNLLFLVIIPYIIKNNPDSIVKNFYSADIGIGYIFISNLIASLATVLLLMPDIFGVFKNFAFDFKVFKKIFVYSFPLLFAGLAIMINETIDRILLENFIVVPENIINKREFIVSQIGIYAANYKIAILMSLFIQTFRYAAEPFFFSQADKKNSKKTYADVMKYFLVFSLIIFLGIIAYLDIIKYFIDIRYHEGIIIVPILLMSKLFYGAVYNLSVWYKLTNKTMYGAYLAALGAVVTIVVNILLIPYIGYLASAWAAFICYFVMMISSYFIGRKYYKINYDLKQIGKYTIIAVFIYLIMSYIPSNNIILQYGINTVLLLSFISFFVLKEKLHLRIIEWKQKIKKV